MNKPGKNSGICFLLLASMIFGGSINLAAAATVDKSTNLNDIEKQIRQADALAQKGREAMSDITAARQLLIKHHDEEARQYLKKARDVLGKLKAEMNDKEGDNIGLLPIYSQLGISKEVEITEELRQKLETTHLDVIRGKHKKVIETLKNINVELQYSFIDLPIEITLGKVESALKSLSEKNIKQATKRLSEAEAELIHDTIVINAVNDKPAG